METKKITKTRIEELLNEDWFFVREKPEEDADILLVRTNLNEAARLTGATPELLHAIDISLSYLVEEIIAMLRGDLCDIWDEIHKTTDGKP